MEERTHAADTGLIQVLHNPDPGEIARIQTRARAEFVSLLERGGLTVTLEASIRWWPLADAAPRRHA